MDYLEIAQLKSKSGVSAPTSVAGPMSPVPVSALGTQLSHRRDFDATGQIAPPGVEPRVTAITWDEEGTRCFQVDAKGICIARREDNDNINGTKLLNVTGMTRGRRFGILDFEVKRHVVRLGPMHLRGIWIPFERALDLANREKITHLVYPLFARNIEELLDHPVNHTLQFELYEGEDEQAVTSLPEGEQLPTPPASKASTVQSASFSTVEDRGATILPVGVSVGSNSSLPSTSGTASPEHTNSSDSIMSVGYLLNDT